MTPPANLTISPPNHDYGNVLEGTSETQVFTVTNTGEQTANVLVAPPTAQRPLD